jgi:4-hydroxy-4-methyl-2-oxoglutarate aldolase
LDNKKDLKKEEGKMFDLGVVHTKIERPDPAAVESLSTFGVPTIHEAMGRVGLMRPYIRPIYPTAKLCGPAITVLLQPGDVVVAGCTTESEDGFFGELLATSMRAQGARGLVIDGGCRDTTELEEMDFPVFSRAINSKGTIKATLGSVNVPVVCANALIHPGDVVVADHDGVVVVPRDRVADVAEKAQAREDREESKRAQFRDGVLGLDLYKMREPLATAGLTYVD